MKIKYALSTIAVTTALAFAGAAHASTTYSSDSDFAGFLVDKGGKSINDVPQPYATLQVDVYNMVNTQNESQSFTAFCFQPDVAKTAYNYQAIYGVGTTVVNTQVRALFESSYKSTIGDADRQFSFQLALWELAADDGNLYATSGKQYFSLTGKYADARVGVAADMLTEAAKLKKLDNTYSYNLFTSADGSASQVLIGVSAVPEAGTWAMLMVGLGLVGLVGRRKSKKSEPFAA